MFNARTIITIAITLALFSIAWAVVEMLQPQDSNGFGHDSYGTHSYGYRGLYEILEEVKVPVKRGLVPPASYAVEKNDTCLVFIGPVDSLVAIEPGFLEQVGEWVRKGGKVVYAPRFERHLPLSSPFDREPEGVHETSVLEALGLIEVIITAPKRIPSEDNHVALEPYKSRTLNAGGALAWVQSRAQSIALPNDGYGEIDPSSSIQPKGTLFEIDEFRRRHTFAGLYAAGAGEVLIFSDAAILCNKAINEEYDNAVILANLFRGMGKNVVFDEFYHGLTIRGNPAWLLTRHPFGILALLLVMGTAVWVWRAAVALGPRLPEVLASRRTIREYVDAMASLFQRADCRSFELQELRDGMLWTIARRLRLGPGKEKLEIVCAVLARKDPQAAERLRAAVAELDFAIVARRATDAHTLEATRHIVACL